MYCVRCRDHVSGEKSVGLCPSCQAKEPEFAAANERATQEGNLRAAYDLAAKLAGPPSDWRPHR